MPFQSEAQALCPHLLFFIPFSRCLHYAERLKISSNSAGAGSGVHTYENFVDKTSYTVLIQHPVTYEKGFALARKLLIDGQGSISPNREPEQVTWSYFTLNSEQQRAGKENRLREGIQ